MPSRTSLAGLLPGGGEFVHGAGRALHRGRRLRFAGSGRHRVPQRLHLHRRCARTACSRRSQFAPGASSTWAATPVSRRSSAADHGVRFARTHADAGTGRWPHASAQGGAALLKCNLNYEQLSVEADAGEDPGLPRPNADERAGCVARSRELVSRGHGARGLPHLASTLDALKTQRPIFVESSFGHTGAGRTRGRWNSRGYCRRRRILSAARIGRDAPGNPSGILEDAAQDTVTKRIPTPTPSDNVKAAPAALDAIRRQGITTFLDAMAEPPVARRIRHA